MVARDASQFEDAMTAIEPVYNYKIGDDVWVEEVPSHIVGDDYEPTGWWDKATIVKLIQSVAGCYEVEYSSTNRRSIVNEYRLRRYVNG